MIRSKTIRLSQHRLTPHSDGGLHMGYNLTVRVKKLDDSIIQQWLSEINKFNMEVEIYPKFSFRNHSGFLPFKIKVFDCPNQSLNHIEFMTGYELYVREAEENKGKGSLFRNLFGGKKQFQSSDVFVDFRISAQDSFEYRIGWYSAASLALICQGVLIDPQEGIQIEGRRLISHALGCVIDDEKQIKADDWRVHKFTGWIE